MKLTLPSGATGFFNDKNEWQCTGSQMGRIDILPEFPNLKNRLRLERVHMVDSAYDFAGAYWGVSTKGQHLYCAWHTEETGVRIFVWAYTRDEAKQLVLNKVPGAVFFR